MSGFKESILGFKGSMSGLKVWGLRSRLLGFKELTSRV